MQIESNNPVNDFVAGAIRQIRLEKGLKALEISRRAGIPQGSYSCLETGRYRLNLDILLRILEALQVDIAQVWPQARPPRPRRPERVTRSWVRQLVLESVRRRPQPISIDDVIEAVCQVAEVSEKELADPSRLQRLARARKLAAFAVRDYPHLTMVDLGRRIRRDTSAMSRVPFHRRRPSGADLASTEGSKRNLPFSLLPFRGRHLLAGGREGKARARPRKSAKFRQSFVRLSWQAHFENAGLPFISSALLCASAPLRLCVIYSARSFTTDSMRVLQHGSRRRRG